MKCLCSFIHHTIWDEQEPFLHIDMIVDCILTGFMKKMQCNALNIITVAKQVWCYFICLFMRRNYQISSDCFEYPQKIPT